MNDTELLHLIRSRVPALTSRGLARVIMELVAQGDIPAGRKMPTVRVVASSLRMSAASVALAWGELVRWQVFETRRRGGTFVLGPAQAPRATRFDHMIRASQNIQINLGNLTPDIKILPPLEPALHAACQNPILHDPYPFLITDALRDAVRPNWPFKTESFLATHGGVDAVELALKGVSRPGDRIIVESPGVSRVLDIVESIGAVPIPVNYGPGGPDLSQLKWALSQRPSAMIYQPIGQSPSGHSVSPMWVEQAGKLLSGSSIPIIELSQASLMHETNGCSLGTLFPERTVRIHSYNYFFGSGLRVGVAGGSPDVIDRMWQPLTFSSRWVSRVFQDALAFQLTDSTARQHLDRYVARALGRHRNMLGALRAVGFDLPETRGPSIWLPVLDEHVATTHMGLHGIVVHPGRYFAVGPQTLHHVLINSTLLDDGYEDIARKLAEAAC